jgi:hypothetical protein
MSFYDEQKSRLISKVIAHRDRRDAILEEIVDVNGKKLTRDQIARLKLYLDTTIEDEQIVANRL